MKDELHVPWSDMVQLISSQSVQNSDGFDTVTETPVQICCNWQDGVSQSEFYLSQKHGMRASAQVEIHKADMLLAWPRGTKGDRFVEFENARYQVLRDFPASIDTQMLILTEVIR